ncbi:Hypothetical_protein [Hexamita inflata]|uniref:Hypothetical_protein n=1 Tax=Hexamita inflata TaxID=28002 RepID=A0AA86PEY0_9EUKA|nr:Hypothetical protein HINF_LOCUS25341 [Hexamita inflata]
MSINTANEQQAAQLNRRPRCSRLGKLGRIKTITAKVRHLPQHFRQYMKQTSHVYRCITVGRVVLQLRSLKAATEPDIIKNNITGHPDNFCSFRKVSSKCAMWLQKYLRCVLCKGPSLGSESDFSAFPRFE